jgi:hypothetical protein
VKSEKTEKGTWDKGRGKPKVVIVVIIKGTTACAEQNKEFHFQTVCRSNVVEERDGVRSQRQSFLVTFCDDKKLQKKVKVDKAVT